MVNRLSFGPPEIFQTGYQTGGPLTSQTYALGKAEQQIFTYDVGTPANNPGQFLLGTTDPLGRTMTFSYDSMGNLTRIVRLAGTSAMTATSIAYEPTFNRVTKITDALGHLTSYNYDDIANQEVISYPTGSQVVVQLNSAGQAVSILSLIHI